jgi:hypothetical protein
MTSIVLVEPSGNIKQIKSKDISRDLLYKKCGFRTSDHFDIRTTWSVEFNNEIVNVELWAKNEGKANNENKYDFPPNVDKDLFFGSCALVRVDSNGTIVNLTCDLWLKIYEKLFGGFEEIDDNECDDQEEEEEDEDEIPCTKTKNGYLKDDFVVDDEDDDEEEGEEDEDGDDNGVSSINDKKKCELPYINVEDEEEDYFGSELEEEAYSYSDED